VAFLSKRRISKDTHIYDFELSNHTNTTLGIDVCSCILVSPLHNASLVRPYTPVSHTNQVGSFSLLVKKYPNGAMGNQFHKLKKGDKMLIRQIPFNKKIQYPFHNPSTIVMLAAGTGITPMYQALQYMFPSNANHPNKTQTAVDTNVILLYASRTPKDIYLKKELTNIQTQFPGRFQFFHILSSKQQRINQELLQNILQSNHLLKRNKKKEDLQIWICGPPTFYDSLCGPRTDQQLSGILHRLGYSLSQIVKF